MKSLELLPNQLHITPVFRILLQLLHAFPQFSVFFSKLLVQSSQLFELVVIIVAQLSDNLFNGSLSLFELPLIASGVGSRLSFTDYFFPSSTGSTFLKPLLSYLRFIRVIIELDEARFEFFELAEEKSLQGGQVFLLLAQSFP
jgi:hypothetical protein